jgi:hypothetical protein
MGIHLPAPDDGFMDPAPARYSIRIHGHLGATLLSAFPALVPERHGADTVLTGLLDRSARTHRGSEGDAIGGVEEHLLEQAGQITVPRPGSVSRHHPALVIPP